MPPGAADWDSNNVAVAVAVAIIEIKMPLTYSRAGWLIKRTAFYGALCMEKRSAALWQFYVFYV